MVSISGPPPNKRLKLAARVDYGMDPSSARRSLSAISLDFWAAIVLLLGVAALILLPPAIFVALDYWRRGGGERAA